MKKILLLTFIALRAFAMNNNDIKQDNQRYTFLCSCGGQIASDNLSQFISEYSRNHRDDRHTGNDLLLISNYLSRFTERNTIDIASDREVKTEGQTQEFRYNVICSQGHQISGDSQAAFFKNCSSHMHNADDLIALSQYYRREVEPVTNPQQDIKIKIEQQENNNISSNEITSSILSNNANNSAEVVIPNILSASSSTNHHPQSAADLVALAAHILKTESPTTPITVKNEEQAAAAEGTNSNGTNNSEHNPTINSLENQGVQYDSDQILDIGGYDSENIELVQFNESTNQTEKEVISENEPSKQGQKRKSTGNQPRPSKKHKNSRNLELLKQTIITRREDQINTLNSHNNVSQTTATEQMQDHREYDSEPNYGIEGGYDEDIPNNQETMRQNNNTDPTREENQNTGLMLFDFEIPNKNKKQVTKKGISKNKKRIESDYEDSDYNSDNAQSQDDPSDSSANESDNQINKNDEWKSIKERKHIVVCPYNKKSAQGATIKNLENSWNKHKHVHTLDDNKVLEDYKNQYEQGTNRDLYAVCPCGFKSQAAYYTLTEVRDELNTHRETAEESNLSAAEFSNNLAKYLWFDGIEKFIKENANSSEQTEDTNEVTNETERNSINFSKRKKRKETQNSDNTVNQSEQENNDQEISIPNNNETKIWKKIKQRNLEFECTCGKTVSSKSYYKLKEKHSHDDETQKKIESYYKSLTRDLQPFCPENNCKKDENFRKYYLLKDAKNILSKHYKSTHNDILENFENDFDQNPSFFVRRIQNESEENTIVNTMKKYSLRCSMKHLIQDDDFDAFTNQFYNHIHIKSDTEKYVKYYQTNRPHEKHKIVNPATSAIDLTLTDNEEN